jgi:hypothetical protein
VAAATAARPIGGACAARRARRNWGTSVMAGASSHLAERRGNYNARCRDDVAAPARRCPQGCDAALPLPWPSARSAARPVCVQCQHADSPGAAVPHRRACSGAGDGRRPPLAPEGASHGGGGVGGAPAGSELAGDMRRPQGGARDHGGAVQHVAAPWDNHRLSISAFVSPLAGISRLREFNGPQT